MTGGVARLFVVLLGAAVFDGVAERARMLPIEGLCHRFHQGAVLGEVDEHGGPCDALKGGPLNSERQANSHHDNNARDALKKVLAVTLEHSQGE